jgi:tetratricopeptide (TPR) repeat protein
MQPRSCRDTGQTYDPRGAYFEKQEFKKAIIEYKNAIQAEPKFALGHYQLALAYLKTGEQREAFAEFSRTVDLNPENLDAQLKLGQFYLLAKKTEMEALHNALRIKDDFPERQAVRELLEKI